MVESAIDNGQIKYLDAIAYGYDKDGLKKLIPIIGIGCRSRLAWKNGSGQECDAPSSIQEPWARIAAWIKENQNG
jgi:hypothetical protein